MGTEPCTIRFWGVRGSYPVPGAHTAHYGGNTPCVEVQMGQGQYPLIIDAGTGIINLGADLIRRSFRQGKLVPLVVTILLTHTHHDHTQGFPFFGPMHIGSSILRILGPRTFEHGLEEAISHAIMPPNFPMTLHDMPSLKILRSLRETELLVLDQHEGHMHVFDTHHDHVTHLPANAARVRVLRSYAHPWSGVYIYRIEWAGKTLVFASDTEGYIGTDRRLVQFAQGADLLIHDAHYAFDDYINGRQGWGHSTPQMACEVAHMSNARQLVLFHHNPLYDDARIAALENEARALFPNSVAAREGLEITL